MLNAAELKDQLTDQAFLMLPVTHKSPDSCIHHLYMLYNELSVHSINLQDK